MGWKERGALCVTGAVSTVRNEEVMNGLRESSGKWKQSDTIRFFPETCLSIVPVVYIPSQSGFSPLNR